MASDLLYELIHSQDSLILGRVESQLDSRVEIHVIETLSGDEVQEAILLKESHGFKELSPGDIVIILLEEDRGDYTKKALFLVSHTDVRELEIIDGPLGHMNRALFQHYIQSGLEDRDFYVKGKRGFLRRSSGDSIQIYPPLLERGESIFWEEVGKGEMGILKKEGEETIILAKDNPSKPVISPRGDRLAFIEPYLWETIGDVFLYDGEREEKELLLSRENLPAQTSPKDLYWLDSHHLLMIIGYAYGTVSVGGDLYLLHIEDRELSLIYETELEEEVKEVKVQGEELLLRVAIFHEDYLDYDLEERRLHLDQIGF